MATSEIEETMKRLMAHKGVQAVVIVNNEGIPIRTSPAVRAALHPAARRHARAARREARGPRLTPPRFLELLPCQVLVLGDDDFLELSLADRALVVLHQEADPDAAPVADVEW